MSLVPPAWAPTNKAAHYGQAKGWAAAQLLTRLNRFPMPAGTSPESPDKPLEATAVLPQTQSSNS